MSKLKLKINVALPQLLGIVVSVALNGEFERFGWFCVDCYYMFMANVTQFQLMLFFSIFRRQLR